MKAVVVERDVKNSLHWREVPDPTPEPGQAVVQVVATAVNRADLLQRKGKYPPPPGAPEWMGLEAAGTIVAFGPTNMESQIHESQASRRWRIGDRVCCLLPGGGYAERVAVDVRLLLPIPADLSFSSAAALPEAFATSYLSLFQEARLASGETVLIHAGASGVGTAAIQLAHEHGCRIVTTVGGKTKAQAVTDLGADLVIDHTVEGVTARLREITSQKPGIDVVLDCIGGHELATHASWLNPDGRWVVIALLAGFEAKLDLRALMAKRLHLIGSTLRARSTERKAQALRAMEVQFWPALAASRIRPVIHAVLPIAKVEEAHAILERRENIGKVVLQIEG